MKRHVFRLLVALFLFLPAAWVQAQITCAVTSPGFTTSYDPTATSQTIVQSNFTVTCVRNLPNDPTTVTYSVGADNGLYNNRAQITTGTTKIGYNLYRDSSCSSQWRNTRTLPNPAGTINLINYLPTSADVSFWGCIPSGQNRPAGTYTDLITMALNWATPNGSQVGSAVGQFNVAILVSATCNVTTAPGPIIFNYTSFGPAANASTTYGATCTSTLPYTMALDTTSGTLLGMNYSLALGSASATGNGVEQTFTISGSMPAGQAGTCANGTCSATGTHTLTISY